MRLTRLLAFTALLAPLTFAQEGFNGPGRYQIRNVQAQKPLDLRGDRSDPELAEQFALSAVGYPAGGS